MLRQRVNDYLKSTKKSHYANYSMVLKTVFMFGLLLVPMAIVILAPPANTFTLFGLYALSGFGMAGVGMGIMHDANHGSYSRHQWINKLLGYSINLLGANHTVWKLQHNVLHHTFTNIESYDDDINAPFFLRFSPNSPRNKLHRFQHLYAWFFYGLSTLSWFVTKDYIRYYRFYKMGLVKSKTIFRQGIFKIIFGKLIYISYTLVLPMIFSGFPVWIILLAFIVKHFITGLCITLVFQTAHVMPNTDFPLPDSEGSIVSSRDVHQMITTSNYALNSRFFSWLIGGLNFQIEHHLFPNICHIHYRKIAPIVKSTAEEFGIPYLYQKNFILAVLHHFKMLRQLGRMEKVMVYGT